MKKVFIISHAMTEPLNQKRWFDFAKLCHNWEVMMLIPKIWRNSWFGNEREAITSYRKEGNLEIIPVVTTSKEKWTLFITPELPKLLREKQPDIVLCFQEEGTISLCWSLICTKLFCPKAKIGFFSWQNIEIHGEKWHQRLRWNITTHLSDFFLAGSNEIATLFKKAGYPKPIYTQTEIGVSSEIFHQNPSLTFNFKEKHHLSDELVIGFAGRLVEEKGIYDLTAALEDLKDIKIKMIWAGDGKERDHLKQLRAKDIFLGQLDLSEMVEFYNGIDLLILPSKSTPFWKEQFGLVAAQSLACHTPVIGSNSGAIPEVVGNDDFIFPEGDSKALANIIRNFIKGSLSQSNKGEKFLTQNIAAQTKEIILEICKN
jgi:glycosyltransferase involved in cell wall biosynthesis